VTELRDGDRQSEAILDLIRGDARHATNAQLGDHTSVSASTVSKPSGPALPTGTEPGLREDLLLSAASR